MIYTKLADYFVTKGIYFVKKDRKEM
ncbi:mltA-interacting domain protein, partial [Yersinia pestis PY-102]